jgi:copper chaperone
MLKLKVSGMTCGHCVLAVTKAIRSIPAVEDVAVDMQRGEVTVRGTPDEQAVRAAVTELGYDIQAAG